MKRSIRVVMKSGYSFSFLCDSFQSKSFEGELVAYSYDGAGVDRPLFIRLDNVDVIIDEGEIAEDTKTKEEEK